MWKRVGNRGEQTGLKELFEDIFDDKKNPMCCECGKPGTQDGGTEWEDEWYCDECITREIK